MRSFPWPLAAWAAVLFLGFAAIYLGIAPSLAYQHWDSLEYAYSCETRGPLATWATEQPDRYGAGGTARALSAPT